MKGFYDYKRNPGYDDIYKEPENKQTLTEHTEYDILGRKVGTTWTLFIDGRRVRSWFEPLRGPYWEDLADSKGNWVGRYDARKEAGV